MTQEPDPNNPGWLVTMDFSADFSGTIANSASIDSNVAKSLNDKLVFTFGERYQGRQSLYVLPGNRLASAESPRWQEVYQVICLTVANGVRGPEISWLVVYDRRFSSLQVAPVAGSGCEVLLRKGHGFRAYEDSHLAPGTRDVFTTDSSWAHV